MTRRERMFLHRFYLAAQHIEDGIHFQDGSILQTFQEVVSDYVKDHKDYVPSPYMSMDSLSACQDIIRATPPRYRPNAYGSALDNTSADTHIMTYQEACAKAEELVQKYADARQEMTVHISINTDIGKLQAELQQLEDVIDSVQSLKKQQ